jgi:hypothetical protein
MKHIEDVTCREVKNAYKYLVEEAKTLSGKMWH